MLERLFSTIAHSCTITWWIYFILGKMSPFLPVFCLSWVCFTNGVCLCCSSSGARSCGSRNKFLSSIPIRKHQDNFARLNGCSFLSFIHVDRVPPLNKSLFHKLMYVSVVLSQVQETVVIETSSYRSFQLESLKTISPDSFCYRFTIPNKGSLNLNVGQHLVLR